MTVNPKTMLQEDDALIVVDVQNDFCPGGALAIDKGDAIIPVLNEWLAAAEEMGVAAFASRDWHPKDHVSFRSEGGPWPPHCIQDTLGASFHPDLTLPDDVTLITKGVRFDRDQNSAFDETGLADYLKWKRKHRLWIGGLAQDVCVAATVFDARKAGFEVHVLVDATRPVDENDGRKALDDMRKAGAILENAGE